MRRIVLLALVGTLSFVLFAVLYVGAASALDSLLYDEDYLP